MQRFTLQKRSIVKAALPGAALLFGLVTGPGCARPQPTQDQVAGKNAPPGLQPSPATPGGASNAPTGGGAGGSAAGGYVLGRVGGPSAAPVTPAYPPGRMSPNGTSGSGLGDRGAPVQPETPMVSHQAPR